MGSTISLRIIPNTAESWLASSSGPTLGHTIGLHNGHAPCQLLVDYDNADNCGGRQFRPIKVVVRVGGLVTTFQKLVRLRWAAVLRPMAWMTIVRLASADSCVQF